MSSKLLIHIILVNRKLGHPQKALVSDGYLRELTAPVAETSNVCNLYLWIYEWSERDT